MAGGHWLRNGYHTNTTATKAHVRTSLLRVGSRLDLDLVAEDRPATEATGLYRLFLSFFFFGEGFGDPLPLLPVWGLPAPVRWRRGLSPLPVLPPCVALRRPWQPWRRWSWCRCLS